MPTIKDIAALAGVSHGTVSNVLNKRNNVSAEKIRAVEDAMRALGYELNESARSLRMHHKNSIALLIPDLRTRHYLDFYESLQKTVRPYGYSVEMYATDNVSTKEQELVRRMVAANVSALIAYPTYIHEAEIYSNIPKSILLGFVGGRPQHLHRDTLLVTFDYRQIGMNIADHVLEKGYREVAIFVDSIRYSDEFVPVIQQALDAAGVNVTVFSSTHRLMSIRAFDIVSSTTKFDAIITANTTRAQAIIQAHRFSGLYHLPHIITLSPERILPEDNFTYFVVDHKKLGRMMGEQIIQTLSKNHRPNATIKLDSEGITEANVFPRITVGGQLEILAAESSATRALQKLLPHFERSTGIKVHFSLYPETHVSEMQTLHSFDGMDLAIAPIDSFHEFRSSILLSKAQQPDLWNKLQQSIHGRLALFYPELSRQHLAFSFAAECQMLFYRRDLLEDLRIMRRYYEQFHEDLTIPTTVEAFDRLIAFFRKDAPGSVSMPSPVAMSALQTPQSWHELLWRLSAEQASLFDADGHPTFCTPAVTQALSHHLSCMQTGAEHSSTPYLTAVNGFNSGGSVFAIFSTAEAPILLDNNVSAVTDLVGWAPVPGGCPLKGGSFIGAVRGAAHLREIQSFFDWLYRENILNIITLICGCPICRSSTESSELLQLYPWLEQFPAEIVKAQLPVQRLHPRLAHSPTEASQAYLPVQHLLQMALLNSSFSTAQLLPSLRKAQSLYTKNAPV